MNGCIHHRGPDEDGFYIRGNCALGHKRLSIIDLTTGGQPIGNEDGSCHIIFNGEIYNHRDLRGELESRGHVFKTLSDTEAILHLYEERGERCVESLRGMFAFAIWNEREQELLLARDRAGKKPLFYAQTPDGIAFASEAKALLAHPAIEREIDLEALDDYVTLQYVPAPRTIFKAIRKLPPAHTLLWRRGDVTMRHYWRLEYEPKQPLGEAEACERLRELLDESVRIRLESEVPLGCLLSGGIDSSAVVAFARRHVSGDLRTFSIGFEEASHNELPHARLIARKFETAHEELIVRPHAIEVLPRIVWHCDEPFADSSALPSYYVAQMTRRHVTVALNGDGGDESFAGYTRYRGNRIVEGYKKIPRLLRAAAIGPLACLCGAALPRSAKLDQLNFLNGMSLMPPDREYAQYMSIFYAHQRARLYGERLRRAAAGRDAQDEILRHYNRPDLRDRLDRMLCADVMAYLPGDLLVKMDRMCMAHSLEARSPFLDHHLMEFAATLPDSLKWRGGTLKYLLKKALEPILPHETLYRPKQGFGVPLDRWFKGELREPLRELLLSDRARGRGFFQMEAVERMIRDHAAGRQRHHHRLWLLLSFEIWCRTFLDRPDPSTGPIAL
jgi:asparagine synthase (glutamine-hydrolysing)